MFENVSNLALFMSYICHFIAFTFTTFINAALFVSETDVKKMGFSLGHIYRRSPRLRSKEECLSASPDGVMDMSEECSV